MPSILPSSGVAAAVAYSGAHMQLYSREITKRRVRIKRWLRRREVPVDAAATTEQLIALVLLAKRAEKGKEI